jgi:aspartokinase
LNHNIIQFGGNRILILIYAGRSNGFVRTAGESVGAFILNRQLSDQTKSLLQRAQQQGEELRPQEEMRQNLEEMEATQEEMRRKCGVSNQLVSQYQERELQVLAQEQFMHQHIEELETLRQELLRQQAHYENEFSQKKLYISKLEQLDKKA